MSDATTFREDVLIQAVDLAEQDGSGNFYGYEAVIARGPFDPQRARNALIYWCGYRREGATENVLRAWEGDALKGSYAINHESIRMRDDIFRSRRAAGTQINQVNGAVHTGSGTLSMAAPNPPAARTDASTSTFWAVEIARRIQENMDACFEDGNFAAMDAGPLLIVSTSNGQHIGYVRLIRFDPASNRFVVDPNGRDGVRVTLGEKTKNIPIAEVRDVDAWDT